eukprot:7306860-Heterocapsa_arctica.AAC.1
MAAAIGPLARFQCLPSMPSLSLALCQYLPAAILRFVCRLKCLTHIVSSWVLALTRVSFVAPKTNLMTVVAQVPFLPTPAPLTADALQASILLGGVPCTWWPHMAWA